MKCHLCRGGLKKYLLPMKLFTVTNNNLLLIELFSVNSNYVLLNDHLLLIIRNYS